MGKHLKSVRAMWTETQIEEFLWGCGVLTLVGTLGFTRAASEEFLRVGLRLATIRPEHDGHEDIHHLSLYSIGERRFGTPRETRAMVQKTMQRIGCPVGKNDFEIVTSGKRVVISLALPRWAWPHHVETPRGD